MRGHNSPFTGRRRRIGNATRLPLSLQTGGKALRLGDPLYLDGDDVDRVLDTGEPLLNRVG